MDASQQTAACPPKTLSAFDARLARRFRDEFQPAFEAWIATNPRTNPNAPASPFEMPEDRVAQAERAKRLNATAGVRSDAASTANERSDKYMLAVVLFATSLFFAAMSTKLHSVRHQQILLGLGGLIFLGAATFVATSPVMFVT